MEMKCMLYGHRSFLQEIMNEYSIYMYSKVHAMLCDALQ